MAQGRWREKGNQREHILYKKWIKCWLLFLLGKHKLPLLALKSFVAGHRVKEKPLWPNLRIIKHSWSEWVIIESRSLRSYF